MGSLDLPKLRPLSATRLIHQGQTFVAFTDPLGAFSNTVLVTLEGFQRVVRHFDGKTPLHAIQARVAQETGRSISFDELSSLVRELDRAMVLDGPTFQAFRAEFARQSTRPPALAGRSYPDSESALRAQLSRYFRDTQSASSKTGDSPATRGPIRGVVSPHIDFERGGPVYSWAYDALNRESDAEVFVVLGVAHQYCGNRFALTTKDFETPLGCIPTNRAFVARVAELAGPHLFDDELAHRTEHSIEFQAVFLSYLFGGRRDFSLVPILVGSFQDLMDAGTDPIDNGDVRRFIEALRVAEKESGKRVAYIGGIDLCHVGPEFGDPAPVDSVTLSHVGGFDEAMLARAVENDPKGWFGTAAGIANRWRVCGLAATYTMLHAMGPAPGRVLKYGQAVNPHRTCCVTFASLAFNRAEGDIGPSEVLKSA